MGNLIAPIDALGALGGNFTFNSGFGLDEFD